MRFKALDGWRGICALLVALFHLNVLSHVYLLPFIRNAFLFVDFFFVLSGFVLYAAYRDRMTGTAEVGTFVVRRIARLYPLHVFVLSAYVAMELVKFALFKAGIAANEIPFSPAKSVESIATNLLLLQSMGLHDVLTWNVPSWSISCEFYVNILFAVVLLALATASPSRSALVWAALAVGGAALVATVSDQGIDVAVDYGFFRCLYGFCCGILVHRLWEVRPLRLGAAMHLVELATVALVVAFVSAAGRSSLSLAAPLVFSLAVWVFASEEGVLSRLLLMRPFQTLGHLSYSVYLLHSFLILNLVNRPVSVLEKLLKTPLTVDPAVAGIALPPDLLKLVTMGGPFAADGLVVVFVAALIYISSLTYRYVENPARRHIESRALRTSARGDTAA